MREVDPVHYNEQIKIWYVFCHEDVQRILGDVPVRPSVGPAGFFQGTKQFPIAFTAEPR